MAARSDYQQAQAALDKFETAYAEAAKRILAVNDTDKALELVTAMREIVEGVTLLRHRLVARVYEEESGSTTRVGRRLGLTKQRADQLVDRARDAGVLPPKQ